MGVQGTLDYPYVHDDKEPSLGLCGLPSLFCPHRPSKGPLSTRSTAECMLIPEDTMHSRL